MNGDDILWWDNFYREIEKGFSSNGKSYVRPKDWLERAQRAESRSRKPVRSQYEGKRSISYDE